MSSRTAGPPNKLGSSLGGASRAHCSFSYVQKNGGWMRQGGEWKFDHSRAAWIPQFSGAHVRFGFSDH